MTTCTRITTDPLNGDSRRPALTALWTESGTLSALLSDRSCRVAVEVSLLLDSGQRGTHQQCSFTEPNTQTEALSLLTAGKTLAV